MADAPDRMYPKQPLGKAIQLGLQRPKDSPMRQKVRMGQNPERNLKEDYSIRIAKQAGQKYERGISIGQAIDEDRAASRALRSSRGNKGRRSYR